MWIAGLRPHYRHISSSFVRVAKRGIWIRRETHSKSTTTLWYRAPPRRGYTTMLFAIPLVAAFYGFCSRRSFFSGGGATADLEADIPVWRRDNVDGKEPEVKRGDDVGIEEGEVKNGDRDDDGGGEEEQLNAQMRDEEEEEEPIEDFTTYPPPVYGRQFWISSITTEEELNHYGQIFRVDIPCGIARYDVAALPSAMHAACFSSSNYFILPSHYWFLFGIYDGHNGNAIASHLSQNLPNAIVDSLVDLYSKHATMHTAHVDLGNGLRNQDYWSGQGSGRPYPPPDDFDASVRQAFAKLDKGIVDDVPERVFEAVARYQNGTTITPDQQQEDQNQLSYEGAATLVSYAHSGSSAVVAIYESDTRQLRLANLGNSRAVLGRRVVDEKGVEMYEVHVLAHELDVPAGFVDDPPRRKPVQESSKLHAFGDGPWKWSEDIRQRLNDAFPFIVEQARPCAEVTAKPEIITFEAQPGDFLVMGSRGLWSSLTHEEAVGLVGLWLKRYRKVVYGDWVMEDKDIVTVYDPETSTMVQSSARPYVPSSRISTTPITYTDVFETRDLPVQHIGKGGDDTFMYRMWGIPKRFVINDRNAAQHLVRNALGGANADMIEALLLMRPPRSRKFRDDVCVEVIFFN